MALESLALGIVGLFMLFMMLLGIILIGLALASFVFWIIMLIDAIKRDYDKSDDKIIWILVIVFIGIIGAIIYYFVVKRKDKTTKKQVKS